MIQAKKNIEEGQDVNVNVTSTISSLLDEIDDENKRSGDLDFDYDKESKKEELKELHNDSISNMLEEIDKEANYE